MSQCWPWAIKNNLRTLSNVQITRLNTHTGLSKVLTFGPAGSSKVACVDLWATKQVSAAEKSDIIYVEIRVRI